MILMIYLFLGLAIAAPPLSEEQALINLANSVNEQPSVDRFFCQVTDDDDDIPHKFNRTRVDVWRQDLSSNFAVQIVEIWGKTATGQDVHIGSDGIVVMRNYHGHELPSVSVIARGEKSWRKSAILSAGPADEDDHCVGFLPLGEYRVRFRLLRIGLAENTGKLPFLMPAKSVEGGSYLVDTRRYTVVDEWYSRRFAGQGGRANIDRTDFQKPAMVPVPIQR